MAEDADFASYHHGDMPIKDHSSTYVRVMGLFKWGALGLACLLSFLTICFCTPAGFMPALVVAVILMIAGIVALRGRAASDH